MSVYNVSGGILSHIYDCDGNTIGNAYDVSGEAVYGDWNDEITVEKVWNASASTYCYIIRIPQTRSNGAKQYPFVFAPNGAGKALYSTLEMNRSYGFCMAINAGVFDMGTNDYLPVGTIIQNSQVLQQGDKASMTTFNAGLNVITISDDGTLSYADVDANAETMINNGIISAVHAFIPIVINGQDAYTITGNSYCLNNVNAQRQLFGQYPNGDYCVITCEGRGFDDSTGLTMPQARGMCLGMGLQFAFNLDGGGSTETVIGNEQINMIYEGTYGRKVPTFIVFNGTDHFFVPNEN